MRAIKFRAWDEKRKAYTYAPDKFSSSLGQYFLTLDGRIYIDGVFQEHLLLEQFTGLLDKNGKEIYEGDLVKGILGAGAGLQKRKGKECVFEVYVGLLGDCGYETRIRLKTLVTGDYRAYPRLSECEVIGNIHEVTNEPI